LIALPSQSFVIPAKAGIQSSQGPHYEPLDTGFRRYDDSIEASTM